MIPVFKGGRKEKTEPASYRPVSVLPALSKVLEGVVVEQFLEYLDENGLLLPKAQHSFRRGHSTVTGAAIASFDYSAAFDTIDKKTVQQRLEDIGANENVKAWLLSYMSGGRQKVRWNGAISSFLARMHGVAQGSQAGPLLFIFITMVNFVFLRRSVGYVDDATNSCSTVKELNSESKVLVSLSKELGLSLNPTKTQCVMYGRILDSDCPVLVDGVTVPPSGQISILGFTLTDKLNPDAYLKELADSVLYRKHVVGRLSAHLPPHILKMFARAVVLGKIRTYVLRCGCEKMIP